MNFDPLYRLFSIAEKYPDQIAVVEPERSINYENFVLLVKAIAFRIKSIVPCESLPRVLIHLPQGIEAYASMFATLMVGGFYSPSDISASKEKQKIVFSQFSANAIITEDAFMSVFQGRKDQAYCLNIRDVLLSQILKTILPQHDLAYVIFTSGSTGEPKGVNVSRKGLEHYAKWATKEMNVSSSDRWSQHPNISFDLSVLDIYGALCSGATLYPLISERDRLLLPSFIKRNKISILNVVPSVVDVMSQGNQMTGESLKSLRLITFCGEPLLRRHLDQIFDVKEDMIVHNTYGPTEATVSCTLLKITKENYQSVCHNSVALGDPISGMGLHLIGGNDSNEGEIVLTGPQVAYGYWKQEALSRECFKDLLINGKYERAYWTGDWAKRHNGQLYFAGRIDNQVKIKGYRVELGAIESVFMRLSGKNCCVCFSEKQLHCFFESREDVLDLCIIKERASELLSEYEIPAKYHFIGNFPRSSNDKTDRLTLTKMLLDNSPC